MGNEPEVAHGGVRQRVGRGKGHRFWHPGGKCGTLSSHSTRAIVFFRTNVSIMGRVPILKNLFSARPRENLPNGVLFVSI